jgi:hypothetical protein
MVTLNRAPGAAAPLIAVIKGFQVGMLAKSVRMPHALLGTALIEMCFSNAFIGTAYTQLGRRSTFARGTDRRFTALRHTVAVQCASCVLMSQLLSSW